MGVRRALVPEAHRDWRVGWADVWYRKQEGSSPYANPVAGLHLVVDLNRMELLEVEDVHRVDEPDTMGESLRVGFNHREGLVLHTVGYDDGVRAPPRTGSCARTCGRGASGS